MEEWRDIKGYEGAYQVSSYGRIRSRFKILKKQKHKQGYELVGLSKNGTTKRYLVHRLVAEAFIKNVDNKPEVNHKDGNKNNNAVENLEWCTRLENIRHAWDTGLTREPTNLNDKKRIRQINLDTMEVVAEYESLHDAYRKTGIQYKNISKVLVGKRIKAGGYHWEYCNED